MRLTIHYICIFSICMVAFILYVRDQRRSRDFYSIILDKEPSLDVPGMTEFVLSENVVLGLMPEHNIEKLLGNKVPNPASGGGIPRCELYLITYFPDVLLEKAVGAGAIPVSDAQDRDWGHRVAYCADPDGHIIAFAKPIQYPDELDMP
jgi:lactoylglutathione lyase